MKNALNIIKRNFIFVIIAFAVIYIVAHRWSELPTSVIMHANDYTEFRIQDEYFSQTWQPTAKRLTKVEVPFVAEDSFDGRFRLEIWNAYGDMHLFDSIAEISITNGEEGKLSFDTGDFTLSPGNRYTFKVYAEDAPADAGILLHTKSNYDGGSIGGVGLDAAINFELMQHMYSKLFWMLGSFGTAIAIAFLFMTCFRKKFEETIGLSYMLIGVVLYAFGLVDRLEYGVYAVYGLSILALLGGIVFYNKYSIKLKELVSPAVFIFGGVLLVIIYTCRGALFTRYDEYYHWGLAVKDMFYFNSFATHELTTVTLDSYPPMSTLFEYFFLYNNGLFSEGIVYVGLQTLMLSTLISIMKPITDSLPKKILTCVIDIIVLLCLPAIYFGWIYYSIYVDGLLGILTAYIFICYYTEELNVFNFLRISAGLCILTLTKDMGLLLALITIFIIAGDRIVRKKGYILSIPVFGLIPVVSYIAWKLRGAHMIGFNHALGAEHGSNVIRLFDFNNAILNSGIQNAAASGQSLERMGFSLDGILQVLNGTAPQYRYDTIANFFKIMFVKPVLGTDKWFIPYVGAIILCMVFLWLSYCRIFDKNVKSNEVDIDKADNAKVDNEKTDHEAVSYAKRSSTVRTFMIFAGIAAVGYAFVMLICYMFIFPEDEAVTGYSMDRYLCSYIGALLITAYMFLRNYRLKDIFSGIGQKALATYLGICSFVLLIIVGTPYKEMLTDKATAFDESMTQGSEEIAEAFRSFGKAQEKVFIWCNWSTGTTPMYYKNILSPIITNTENYDIVPSLEWYEENVIDKWGEPRQMTMDAMKAWMQGMNFNYVLILNPYDCVRDYYGELFEDPNTIRKGAYYRVLRDGDNIRFHYIGAVDIYWTV